VIVCNSNLIRSIFYDPSSLGLSYFLPFEYNGRKYTLYESKQEAEAMDKTAYNNFIFLKAETRSNLYLKMTNRSTQKRITNMLGRMLGTSKASYEIGLEEIRVDGFLTGMRLTTNNPTQAKQFLNNTRARGILSNFRIQYSYSEFIMPLFIEPNNITLDYRLSAKHLNEIINNPRNIKKHFDALHNLAIELEKIETNT